MMLNSKRSSATEQGFTLVEVVACVVIMAIIIVPLSTTLIQAMNLVPAAGGRTQLATGEDRLQSTLTDDLQQANYILLFNAYNASGTAVGSNGAAINNLPPVVPLAFGNVAARATPCVTTAAELAVLQTANWDATKNYAYMGANDVFWNTGALVQGPMYYWHVYNMKFTPINAGLVQVQVIRTDSVWDFTTNPANIAQTAPDTPMDEPTPYLTGYCKPGDAGVVSLQATAPGSGTPPVTHENVQVTFNVRSSPSALPTSLTIDGSARFG
jgi:prepilin-type N-terminal cleavage/methylation domain-containing protein